jgi:transposase
MLGGTTGRLVADAHTGYNAVADVNGHVRAGCLAHVRRKVFDALSTASEAQAALDLILDVYRVEHHATERGIVRTDARVRHARSCAAMAKRQVSMTAQLGLHLPQRPRGKAISYALEHWDHLQVFLDDARVPVDNKASVHALSIVALGRKRFMFVGKAEAGQNLTVLYSLMATCEEHGVVPSRLSRRRAAPN